MYTYGAAGFVVHWHLTFDARSISDLLCAILLILYVSVDLRALLLL